MIPLTIAVTLVAVALALWVKPPTALGILICTMMLYPEYLRIPVGPIKMSVPRFVALALAFRLASGAAVRGFRWRLIDGLVCFEWVWAVTANILAGSDQARLSEVVGRVFDSVLMYFVARLCMPRLEGYRKLALPLVICAIVAGGLGAIEAVTHYSPYQALRGYTAIQALDPGAVDFGRVRFGFFRAQGATEVHIYFGMAMFLLAGILYGIRGYAKSRLLWTAGFAGAVIGALSSMSSGPISALITALIVGSFFFFPWLIRYAVAGLILLILFCQAASSRNFWYLIEYLNPTGGDWWYRARLIDTALAQWRDYWLVGVGSNIPNQWGKYIDGRTFVDIVNEYVIVAITSGFLGLACRVAIQAGAIKETIRTYRRGDRPARQLAFGQAATLIGLIIGSLSVGSYGAPLLLSYILLGLMLHNRAPFAANGAARPWGRKGLKRKRIMSPREAESLRGQRCDAVNHTTTDDH